MAPPDAITVLRLTGESTVPTTRAIRTHFDNEAAENTVATSRGASSAFRCVLAQTRPWPASSVSSLLKT